MEHKLSTRKLVFFSSKIDIIVLIVRALLQLLAWWLMFPTTCESAFSHDFFLRSSSNQFGEAVESVHNCPYIDVDAETSDDQIHNDEQVRFIIEEDSLFWRSISCTRGRMGRRQSLLEECDFKAAIAELMDADRATT